MAAVGIRRRVKRRGERPDHPNPEIDITDVAAPSSQPPSRRSGVIVPITAQPYRGFWVLRQSSISHVRATLEREGQVMALGRHRVAAFASNPRSVARAGKQKDYFCKRAIVGPNRTISLINSAATELRFRTT